MTDMFAILLSCALVVWIVRRAVALDARLPWFTALARMKDPGDA